MLKACSKLNPGTDDQIFDLNKQTQVGELNAAIKKKFPMKLLAAGSLIQMMYRRYIFKFLIKFYGISYYFF